ncbi:hypothetical protein ACIQTT_06775 [Microbacterium sp. NPDC090225]|uniref:hypothetical protein n=1 Tax=Microbacterium sp. NPDC090225 TaxID=3364207 RepID=UPI003801D715
MNAPVPSTASTLVDSPWTLDLTDPYFTEPYVDVDEWRETPVGHRHVHGGFRGTDTRFSFYFPEADRYEGRFFQHVTPVPQSENLAPTSDGEYNKIVFATDSGAYFIETNGGGPDAANPFSGMDPSIGAYRASAASARFSRHVAAAIYGAHRPYGYLYGGSGGAYRTIGSSENTNGVWDGFVPYVPGSPMSIPNVFSVRMHAQRILRDKFPAIVDAYDVGGDPASLHLTPEEAEALEEVTRMGFPPRSWFGFKTMGMHAFSVLYPGMMAADPNYADDFWAVKGYLGADPTSSAHRDRVRLDSTIAELITGASTVGEKLVSGGVDESFLHVASDSGIASGIRLSSIPEGWVLGAQLIVKSGAGAGSVLRLSGVEHDVLTLEPGQDEAAELLAVGDEITLDNSTFLAAQTYHRHQVPGPEYAVWDQFRDDDGEPVYPQRGMLLGPMFTVGAAGTVPTGQISGKMIAVACLLDREAFPWQADWYRSRVEEHLGEQANDRFRLWFVDNAVHGDDDPQEFPDRTVTYVGALEAALRQLAAWVEAGVEPAPTSTYQVVDGQVTQPDTAEERGGVQPVVSICVNGSPSAVVRAGESAVVTITAVAPGTGVIASVDVDLTGSGNPDTAVPVPAENQVTVERVQAFSDPGTYFLSARVAAQSAGDATDPHARVPNVARARVVVIA